MGMPSTPMHLPCTLASIWDQPATAESTIRVVAANIIINFLFISVSCSTFFLQLNSLCRRPRLVRNRIGGPRPFKSTQAEQPPLPHSPTPVLPPSKPTPH